MQSLRALAPLPWAQHLLYVLLFSTELWMRALVLRLGPLGEYPTTILELFAVVTGLACVYLTVKQHLWCWPIGIVSAAAFAWLFLSIRLLADAYLQIFFIGTSVYGWWWWKHGGPHRTEAPVSTLDARQRWLWLGATVLAVLSVGYIHANYTKADLPYLDALASGASVTAQLLMMRKKLECWPLWVAIDVLSFYIYVLKQVYFTAALYSIFCCLAVLGWLEWNRSLHTQMTRSEPSAA